MSPSLPRFSIATAGLWVGVVAIFLGLLTSLPTCPPAVSRYWAYGLTIVCLLAPFAMWFLPHQLRWPLWGLVYLLIFLVVCPDLVQSQGSIAYFWLYAAAVLGASAGLSVNSGDLARKCKGQRHRIGAAVAVAIGFGVAVTVVFVSAPLLLVVTGPLRGDISHRWEMGMVSRRFDTLCELLNVFAYLTLSLASARAYVMTSGRWKGAALGSFTAATLVASLEIFWFFH